MVNITWLEADLLNLSDVMHTTKSTTTTTTTTEDYKWTNDVIIWKAVLFVTMTFTSLIPLIKVILIMMRLGHIFFPELSLMANATDVKEKRVWEKYPIVAECSAR